MTLIPELASLLGTRALSLIAGIDDAQRRARVISSLEVCARTLVEIDRLELAKYEMTDLGLPDLSVWEAAAPEVRRVLVCVGTAIEALAALFPAVGVAATETIDIDAAFAEFTGDEAPIPMRDDRAREIDDIVNTMNSAAEAMVGDTIAWLAGMLRSDFVTFGKRLRSPKVVADRWYLLGELQEFRSKCSKCLEAIVAAVLNSLGKESLEDLLPRYGTEGRRAALLRAAVVELAFLLRDCEERLGDCQRPLAGALVGRLTVELDAFAETPAYRHMRAQDKREFIVFRMRLRAWDRATGDRDELHGLVDGFAAFLEVMRGINRREELVSQDRVHLAAAKLLLDSNLGLDAVLPHLDRAFGRDLALDRWLRAHRAGAKPPTETLAELVGTALAPLQA